MKIKEVHPIWWTYSIKRYFQGTEKSGLFISPPKFGGDKEGVVGF
jgi:hypothetical protein